MPGLLRADNLTIIWLRFGRGLGWAFLGIIFEFVESRADTLIASYRMRRKGCDVCVRHSVSTTQKVSFPHTSDKIHTNVSPPPTQGRHKQALERHHAPSLTPEQVTYLGVIGPRQLKLSFLVRLSRFRWF